MAGANLFHHVEDIWLQVLRAVGPNSQIELQVVRVPLEGLAHTLNRKARFKISFIDTINQK